MEEEAEIRLCEPAPFIYFENGQIAVTDGSSVWLVIVTCEAMKATASPPEKSLRRLVRYAGFYRDVAAAQIRRGEDVDGKVWVRERDVLAAKGSSNLGGKYRPHVPEQLC
ncbi:hypothetical protein SAMN03159496_06019 [Rhizobium sp. NFR07]|uniref:hypothetical protein n=1 Tax=Rhizobium sp. NFR07 TaxID=1566262 RepID=UPI0008E51896|nr:hypothetical protein [Rhizobium sp. NFR07]SFB62435.1 hypothetical protein SAMN03159496_06019 [Rhizobium sp. NFR07]